ncbi:thylakoid lumenal 17.9 kDa protein, chloroplast [Actinidia rufa]|uniref:Thylakoid lumenal 17.9 kDa protein, chloroplast n=1 Tax=Actinidia rufa TaxID=165716 RepID=A0A7J0G0Q1_9ERIC|nr:thylakoid lumenal 17.9 kDa protein, chloroplast [Actinidia rufa]
MGSSHSANLGPDLFSFHGLMSIVRCDALFLQENGKIRPCPSINPSCVSTNPKSSSFAFPWTIPENRSDNAIQKLQEAILVTQKNAKIQVIEDTPDGQYLQAEIDGGFGRDVLEFLVKGDVVAYRCMATKARCVNLWDITVQTFLSMSSIWNFLGDADGGHFSEVIIWDYAYPGPGAMAIVQDCVTAVVLCLNVVYRSKNLCARLIRKSPVYDAWRCY